jgi:RNA polymerase sigma factor (sigma-70 family)
MPWTELGRANRHRVSIDFGLVGPSQGRGPFANFISKPAYEPGDVPRFDKCRFVTMVARDHINGFGGGEPRSGPRGAALPATWEGGNKSEPSAKVTRPAKSYEQLGRAARPVDAEGNPRPPWDPKYNYVWTDSDKVKAEKYSRRCKAAQPSYGDIRRHGKARCKTDETYAQAAKRDAEAFLHYAIDEVASKRRGQVKRAWSAPLRKQNRQPPHLEHRFMGLGCDAPSYPRGVSDPSGTSAAVVQPSNRRRLLYLLRHPRSWLEARILMHVLGWFLTQREAIQSLGYLSTSKAVNCVSDDAMRASKARDGRGTPKRQRVAFLSREEELELVTLAKNGDLPARNRLFIAQWPLVVAIAQKHASVGAATEDLIQEAYGGVNGDANPVGLMYALDKFDPEKNFRFSTFARRPIEWAIQDYKRREHKKEIPLDGEVLDFVSSLAYLGNFNDSNAGTTRTSRLIIDTTNRMTGLISPYVNGLAPETHDFIAELNSEAELHNSGVKFVGLANKIEVNGNIKEAAEFPNLGGWFLRRALKKGFSEGEEAVLKADNSKYKKHLRKMAKRKPK